MLYKRQKFPDQVFLDPDEAYRVNRVRIARYYGITPAAVDAMSEQDVQDTMEIMWAESQK